MKKRISVLLQLLPFTYAIAGDMGTLPATYAGLWAGVGGGYVNTQLNGKTTITTHPYVSAPATYVLSQGRDNHLAPTANVGYLYPINNEWLLGLKGLYKYIGIEQFDLSWAGTLQNGAYQTGGIHSKFQDEWLFLVSGGYQINQWLFYAGLGPALYNTSAQLNGDTLPALSFEYFSVNQQTNKSVWGGAGQVGVEYMLPNRFTVDLSYNFGISQQQNIPSLMFPSGSSNYYTSIVQSLQAMEQGFNITINKYFWG